MNVCRLPAVPKRPSGTAAEERVYLYPGALWAGEQPSVITTVLGSCVAVCLWSDSIAGINHFILPRGGSSPSAKYGNHALPMLLERVLELGASVETLFAAVFGGASVLGGAEGAQSLGSRNVIEARQFLEGHGIPVIRTDVGGEEGRKLTFRTIDGTTFVRKL